MNTTTAITSTAPAPVPGQVAIPIQVTAWVQVPAYCDPDRGEFLEDAVDTFTVWLYPRQSVGKLVRQECQRRYPNGIFHKWWCPEPVEPNEDEEF